MQNFEQACEAVGSADIFLVVGALPEAHPAASLADMTRFDAGKYFSNPDMMDKQPRVSMDEDRDDRVVPGEVVEYKSKEVAPRAVSSFNENQHGVDSQAQTINIEAERASRC